MSVVRMQADREARRAAAAWTASSPRGACRPGSRSASAPPASLLLALLFYLFAPSANSQTVADLAAHHLDRQPGPVRRFPAAARPGRAARHRLPRRGRGRPGRAGGGRGRRHRQPGPAARGPVQLRSPAEPARPPDRGHPADQLDAQPGAGAEPDPARQRAGADRGRPRHPDRAAPITRCSGRSPSAASSPAAPSPTAATPTRPIAAARDVLRRQQATDERLQSSQLAQLRASAAALNASLDIARATPRRAQPARAGRRASSPPSRSRSASR